MSKIFWGLILLFFDINITTESGIFSLLPVFVGYWLIANGSCEMKQQLKYFAKVESLSVVMIFFSTFLYAKSMFGMTFDVAYECSLMAIGTLFNILILFFLAKAVKNLDENFGGTLNFGMLYLYCGCFALSISISLLGYFNHGVAIYAVIASLVFGLLYTFKFRKIKIAYQAQSNEDD